MTVNRRYCTAWLGFASQESALDQTSAGPPARFEPAVAINPVIAHPMLSRGNEVANRTNFVAVHESGIDAVDGSSTGTRVPRMWALLRLPRFRGASHADDHDNRSRHCQVSVPGSRS